MIYVDTAVYKKKNGRKKYCHLTADSIQEMHEFCQNLGIGKHFYHKGANHPHYDLNEVNRIKAIEAGAVEVSSKEFVKIAKKLV